MHYLRSFTALFACLVWASVCLIADEPLRLPHRWEVEPDLGVDWLPPIVYPPVSLAPESFASPKLQVVLDEAQLALRHAKQPGLTGGAASLDAILARLKTTTDNRQVTLALAGAAIALASPADADALWNQLSKTSDTRPVIERQLIHWKSPLAIDTWRARLTDPNASLSELRVAIEGVGVSGNEQDRSTLEALLRSDRLPVALKIVVAHSLGSVARSNLESLANEVSTTEIEHRDLLVAEMLANHTSQAAREQLLKIIAGDHQPARILAYSAISLNHREVARALAAEMLTQTDHNLRAQAVAVLDQYDDAESLRLQAGLIGDDNYQLRVSVRKNLERKAEQPSLRPVVDEVIDEHLNGERYQSIEQAILISVMLREAERCPTYLKLLEHPRIDTRLIAAWALQELAQTPELMDGILVHAKAITQRLVDRQRVEYPEHLALGFLFEAFGRNRYEPSIETLRLFIRKDHAMGDLCRGSAIWSLGKILEDSQNTEIASLLAERMLDESITDPEDPLVKFTSTLALGWIKAPGSLEQVNLLRAGSGALGLAAGWSKEQLKE